MNIQDEKNLPCLIKEILGVREPKRVRNGRNSYRQSSVLIPLLKDDGIHKILFTKRTDYVEHHKGQISFPGGSVDKEDGSLLETALRESEEEIGLSREDVEILGRLDDILTMASDFIVYPFVGLVPYPYNFIINNIEVERLITVPLDVFQSENTGAKIYTVESEGMVFHTHGFEYNGDLIWGATARMMENFICILNDRLGLPNEKK